MWSAFCSHVYIRPLQNASFLDRTDPDLPVCVERTVLVWVPLGFLWLFAPLHLARLFKKKAPTTPFSKLYICKQVEVIEPVIHMNEPQHCVHREYLHNHTGQMGPQSNSPIAWLLHSEFKWIWSSTKWNAHACPHDHYSYYHFSKLKRIL